jgi:ubiquinone/menaquinone biosynthesis C-methylase UbiE
MKYLLNFAQLQGNEKVLDLAAGTGHISKIILEQLPQINLTVLDASPRMLESCKKILGDRSRYALCKVPTILRDERLIDLETRRGISKKFDAILIHLALPAVAKCINELRELARWCKTLLVDGGRVFLCAHNTAVKINSSNFDISKDPLRLTLKDVVNRMDFKKGYLRSIDELEYLERCFDQNNIEKAFNDVGYLMEKRDESNFFMTMDDRFAMWRTPAVMDEILDIEQMLADYRDTFNNDAWNNKIIDEVEKRIKNKPTPDMQVIYWAFQYRKTHK